MTHLFYLFILIALNINIMIDGAHFFEQPYVDNTNKNAKTWKTGSNLEPNTLEMDLLKNLAVNGVLKPEHRMYKWNDSAYDLSIEIPKIFDARKQWKMCSIIGTVIDKGCCGNDWAVSTSMVLAARLCIASNHTFNQMLSVEKLSFCCGLPGCNGCNGGNPITSWVYMKLFGIPTGGEYNTTDGCAPYLEEPLNRTQTRQKNYEKEELRYHYCPNECYGNTTIKMESDRRYVKDFYFLPYENIQRDIMTYGPVQANIWTYTDFEDYKSGVYVLRNNGTRTRNGTRNYRFLHSVQVIGWGEENNTPYWLCVHSWGNEWGENGLFKIGRGQNEFGDDWVTAATPLIG